MLPVPAELSVKSHREAGALYAALGPESGTTFRARLDRRLRERDRAPVAWDAPPCDSAA